MLPLQSWTLIVKDIVCIIFIINLFIVVPALIIGLIHVRVVPVVDHHVRVRTRSHVHLHRRRKGKVRDHVAVREVLVLILIHQREMDPRLVRLPRMAVVPKIIPLFLRPLMSL